MDNYRLIAPDISRLLYAFEHKNWNTSPSTPELDAAMGQIFDALEDLAPLKNNSEAKQIWLRIPRGTIQDYGDFEELKDINEYESYEQFREEWEYEFPYDPCWYLLSVHEIRNKDGSLRFRGLSLGKNVIISAELDQEKRGHGTEVSDECAVLLCQLILPAIEKSMQLIREGKYNDLVASALPYPFRTGVIVRSDLWRYDPEQREYDKDNLSDDTISRFISLLDSGANDETRIARIHKFTANDFYNACAIGYKALGYDVSGTPQKVYMRYADGRDEGLTGLGYGIHKSPGVPADDPAAWDDWYRNRTERGGHPWEVVRGGNSTHLSLFVRHDSDFLEWDHRAGRISDDEFEKRSASAGYYFSLSGKHRPLEAVTFYVALSEAGLPVLLSNADELRARFEGSDYIGIVPHDTIPKYCESMFPSQYRHVIDFIHVFDDDLEVFGKAITWLQEDPAEFRQ